MRAKPGGEGVVINYKSHGYHAVSIIITRQGKYLLKLVSAVLQYKASVYDRNHDSVVTDRIFVHLS